jgi:hypothetical protein
VLLVFTVYSATAVTQKAFGIGHTYLDTISFVAAGTCLASRCGKQRDTQTHGDSGVITEDLLQAVFPVQSDLKSYKEDNFVFQELGSGIESLSNETVKYGRESRGTRN